MNEAHLHLLVNHFPIITPMVGFLVLCTGLVLRSEILKRTAFMIFVAGALFTLPAMGTGEGAEEILEKIPGIGEDYIHTHEELAEKFAILSYLLGALSLFGFWANWKQKRFASLVTMLVLVMGAAVLVLGVQTGNSGGEIRHTEIRSGGAALEAPHEE